MKIWAKLAMFIALLASAAQRSVAQGVPPDAPANVRAIMEKMQHGHPPTQGEIQIVAAYFQHKKAKTPQNRPVRSGPPNLDAVKGIPCLVTVQVHGRFTGEEDKKHSSGAWTMSGSFPCRLKVSEQAGRAIIDPANLAAAQRFTGVKMPNLSRLPSRVPDLSSIPLRDSTASFHFVSDAENAAHLPRSVHLDVSATSPVEPNPGNLEMHGGWTPDPRLGFDMTLTNFNHGDPLFAFAMMPGISAGTTNLHSTLTPPDANVRIYAGVADVLPDETAQMADLVKSGMASPKPSMPWSTRQLRAAINSGQANTISSVETFHQHIGSGDSQYDASGISTISITLRPKPMQLVVAVENYDDWLPEGGQNEDTKGNQLRLHATLQSPSGDVPTAGQRASNIRFELSQVSKEPGVSLNWPQHGKSSPDLKFDRTDAGNVKVISDSAAERIDAEGQHFTVSGASANIACFDWGANAVLKVTAQMPDGRTLEGRFTSNNDTELRLPKRSATSKIADKWKAEHGATGADSDDNETSNGNRHNGDGFTNYEEYRGLMVKGAHQFLTPKRKDLVVVNKIGDLADDGIQLFGNAADAKVWTVDTQELDADSRVVNVNHGTAFGGEQHGLIIEDGDTSAIPVDGKETMSDALASVVPPKPKPDRRIKDTTKIMVNLGAWRHQIPANIPEDEMALFVERNQASLRVAIAHEMGHAVGLLHHGKRGAADLLILPSSAEHAFDLKGDPIVPPAEGLKVQNIGAQNGEASGDADCIMCYTNTFAWAQLPPLPGANMLEFRFYQVPPTRYSSQNKFCVDGKGAGLNAADNKPISYFGDASNGGCAGKMIFKDW